MSVRYDYEAVSFRRSFYLEYPEHILARERNQSLTIVCESFTGDLPLIPDKYLAPESALEKVWGYHGAPTDPKTIATNSNIAIEDVQRILDHDINVVIQRIDRYLNSAIENSNIENLTHLSKLMDMATKSDDQVFSRADLKKTMWVIGLGFKISISSQRLESFNKMVQYMSNSEIEKMYLAIRHAEVVLPFYYGSPRQEFLKSLFTIREEYSVRDVLSSFTKLSSEILSACITRLESDPIKETTLLISAHPDTSSHLKQAGYLVKFLTTGVTLTNNNQYRICKRLQDDTCQTNLSDNSLIIMFREAYKYEYLFLLKVLSQILKQRDENHLRRLLKETLRNGSRHASLECFSV